MYWNLFVGLKNGLMSKMPFSRNLLPLCMWASRKSICCSCASQVNVRFGWCEFKCVMKFLSSSLPCVQIMKISSMYLFQVCGFLVHLARNSCSTESMKRFANVGANFVPMAVPHFCLYIFPANSKMLCSSIIRMRLAILSLSPFSSGK